MFSGLKQNYKVLRKRIPDIITCPKFLDGEDLRFKVNLRPVPS